MDGKELAQEVQQEPEAPESKIEKRYVVISEEDLDNLIRNAGREGAKKGVEALSLIHISEPTRP